MNGIPSKYWQQNNKKNTELQIGPLKSQQQRGNLTNLSTQKSKFTWRRWQKIYHSKHLWSRFETERWSWLDKKETHRTTMTIILTAVTKRIVSRCMSTFTVNWQELRQRHACLLISKNILTAFMKPKGTQQRRYIHRTSLFIRKQ